MLKQLTTPTNMGITLVEAKEFLRVEFDDDDSIITEMIKASTLIAQNFINQQITQCQYAEAYSSFDMLAKNRGLVSPVVTIDSVKYYDENNTLQTVSSSDYYLMSFGLPNKIAFNDTFSTPSTKIREDAVQITYTSGKTTIEEDIKSYIKIKVSTLYENREQFSTSITRLAEIPDKFLNSLLYGHKVFQ